jgi:anaerobic magnesium-protoporphyrin IX monomethyl ester cyclase
MRFLLVYPPLDSHTRYWHPHLGLGYLSAVLEAAGHETEVADAVAEGWGIGAFSERFDRMRRPDAVLITATTSEISGAHDVASVVKAASRDIVTVVGGPHATALPEATLRQYPDFDIACIGEGELTVRELAQALEGGNPLKAVKGIAYRQGGEIVVTPCRDSIGDLDALPFPRWEGFPLARYSALMGLKPGLELPVMSGRGCPNRCVFCQRALGSTVRVRSAANVADEVDRDVALGAKSIYFCDETFTLSKKRTVALMQELMRRGLEKKVSWHCETRVDSVDAETLRLMRQAGCRMVAFGVESGSDRVLKEAGKAITSEMVRAAYKAAKEAGLLTYMYLIFGLPYETEESVKETVGLLMEADPDYVTIGILVPYPGTEVLAMAERGLGGLRLLSSDWRDYSKQSGKALELESLPAARLRRLQSEAYVRFYLRPSKIRRLLEMASLSGMARMTLERAKMAIGRAKRHR